MISVLASHLGHQTQHQKALIDGLRVHGVAAFACRHKSQIRTKHVACWGWRNGKLLKAAGYEVLVLERGYVGDRFKYTSLGWNGLNGYAEFPEYPSDGGVRFRAHGGEIKPWRDDGEYALILGQVPMDASLKGMDMVPWYREQATLIRNHYQLPVHFRPHPDCRKKGIVQRVHGTAPSIGTLDEALSGAKFAVCFNSNSSVDSVLAGVPCVVGDKGSMAYDVCSHSVFELITPEREQWAWSLAQKQWTLAEISSGEALKGIVCRLG